MFNKKRDICLRITNMILIIIATISLGIGIGSQYYNDTDGSDCAYYSEFSKCKEYTGTIYKTQNIAYSIFGTSFASLIICNLINIKNK